MATERVFWKLFGTPSAIYGTVVYASLIAAAAFHGGAEDVWGVFLFSATTIVTFWLAHVFAEGLAHRGSDAEESESIRTSIGHGFVNSIGVIEAAVLPSVPLALGSLGLLGSRQSIQLSLLTSVGVLFVLGLLAVSARHRAFWVRIVSAAVTALFGVVIILIEANVH